MTEPLQAGYYRARAIKPDGNPFGKSKQKGTDFVRISFRIVDGEYTGRTVSWDGYFTDETSERTIQSLRYCGCTFPNDDITNLTGVDTCDVMIDVERQEYQKDGEIRTIARVAWVNSMARGVATELQMDDMAKASFADKMRGKLQFSKAGKPAAGSSSQRRDPFAAPATDPAPPNDDDIPF